MKLIRALPALLAALVLSGPARAAPFPDKPLTLVVPYPPGGATDTVARIMATGLSRQLGQPVIINNIVGAGTVTGAGAVAQSAPDGYTLLISSNTTFTINPALKPKLPYDPLQSFESLGLLGSSPLVLLAHPSVPADTVQQLVALARAQPGKLNIASFGTGTSSHFAGEMFKRVTGTLINHVPYKGSAPAMQDLISGHVQLSFDTMVAALPQLQAGKVKALAVASLKRSPSLPRLPSVAQSGYPGFEMVPWLSIVAPRGLPADVRRTLGQAFADTVNDAATRAELVRVGIDAAYEPPAAYEQRVAKELPLLRAYAHQAGISAD
jgi:tripartite-type tricarboxylate transporter receptor subunit TctC